MGLIWDEASMTSFLLKPKTYIGKIIGKKNAKIKMAFGGLKNNNDARNLIAYLKQEIK